MKPITRFNRREFLVTASVGIAGLAGCSDETDPSGEQIELENPSLGDSEAPQLLVFEDLGCPSCANYNQQIFPNVKEDYIDTGKVQYIFYDLVLPANTYSKEAHQCARAVQDVEDESSMWDFKAYVFENQNRLDWDLLEEAAETVSNNVDEIITKAENKRYQAVIDENGNYAEELGIPGTPGFYMNETVFDGFRTYSGLASQIDRQLGQL
jgi:protein-disulfide isomerase